MSPSDGISDEDLLGGDPTIPDSSYRERLEAMRAAAVGRCFVDANELLLPVSRNFLATVFQMDQATVKKRLLHCRTIGSATADSNKRDLYDFREAVAYLVPPKMDFEQFMRSMDAAKLPPYVNKMVWEGLRQKLRYKVEAQEAWRTEDVQGVFGDVFMTIKDHTQMWVEEMREKAGLTDEQTARFEGYIDTYRETLHEKLVVMPTQRQTRAVIYHDDAPFDGVTIEG